MKLFLISCCALFFSCSLFAQIKQTEEVEYTRGVLPEAEDLAYSKTLQRSTLVSRAYVAIPPAKSLRAYSPIPQAQGKNGNCTGWAAAYCARTILDAIAAGETDKKKITENAYAPGFSFLQGGGNAEKCYGAFTTTVVRTLGFRGAVRIKDMVVENGTAHCPQFPINQSVLNASKPNIIPYPVTLWAQNFDDIEVKKKRVKKAIAENHPVVISMVVPQSFDQIGSDGLWKAKKAYPDAYDRSRNCHAMTVVGYDDNRFGGTFEIQNSWGTKFGDNGYVYVGYEDFGRYVYQAFEVFKTPLSEGAASPEELMLSGSLRLMNVRTGEDLPVKLAEKTRNWTVGGGDGDFTYEIAQPLRRGIRMRLMLESKQPAFVYLLGTGTQDPGVQKLFPFQGFSPAMNYSGYEVALPSESQYITDNSVGENYLVLLYSAEELDIDSILGQLNEDKSIPIYERLNAVIRDQLINSENITFARDMISFEAPMESGKTAFAMIIRSEHVE